MVENVLIKGARIAFADRFHSLGMELASVNVYSLGLGMYIIAGFSTICIRQGYLSFGQKRMQCELDMLYQWRPPQQRIWSLKLTPHSTLLYSTL